MKLLTLLYHDVVNPTQMNLSGFSGPGANVYKLSKDDFRKHIDTIKTSHDESPVLINEVSGNSPNKLPLLLTFDDGGKSALEIADILEANNWRGHFFVTTNYINQAGFLSVADIKDLVRRGHIIGSHSCSHPNPMGKLSQAQILREWQDSCTRLSDITQKAIICASIPGGYYSSRVSAAANAAGIKYLFTSEPIISTSQIESCMLIGRYTLWQNHNAAYLARLIGKQGFARKRQFYLWNSKKLLKKMIGPLYNSLRHCLLSIPK